MPVTVVHIINSLDYGGAERRTISILNRLNRRDYAPILVCLNSNGGLRSSLHDDVKVFDLWVRKAADLGPAAIRLFDLLRRIRPSIVHTHLVHAGLIGRAAARAAGVPHILSTQHNAYYPKQQTYLHRAERRSWHLAEVIIALSNAIEAHLRAFGFQGRIAVIPSGVNVDSEPVQRNALSDNQYILSVGHFRDAQKGHDLLVRAFAQVRHLAGSLKLLIAGDGPEQQMIANLIRSLGLADSVFLLGKRADVNELMRECSIFALASRWEGFGFVLIEAMSWGCPIVATTVEAISEIVENGRSGILVPPDDVTALANAITYLIRNPAARLRLGQRAHELAQARFAVDRMVSEEMAIYEELTSN